MENKKLPKINSEISYAINNNNSNLNELYLSLTKNTQKEIFSKVRHGEELLIQAIETMVLNNLMILNDLEKKLKAEQESNHELRSKLVIYEGSLNDSEKTLKLAQDSNQTMKSQIDSLTQNLLRAKEDFNNQTKQLEQTHQILDKTKKLAFFESDSKPTDFYDAIIYFDSVLDLNNGLKVTKNPNTDLLSLLEQQGTTVAVVGGFNKGKTFCLDLISGSKTPSGFNIRTPGISIKYFFNQETGAPFIGLDTQGTSLPIIGNYNKDDGIYRSKLRDRQATEDIIQNFILETSSIILIVVGDLTFEDQKLVTKIKNNFKETREKALFVIHNLIHCNKIQEVQDNIDTKILNSFSLTRHKYIFNCQDKNNIFYSEKVGNSSVVHIIFAKDSTDAGEHYNHTSLQFLLSKIQGSISESVNIFNKFESFLNQKLPHYIDLSLEESKKLKVQLAYNDKIPIEFKLKEKIDSLPIRPISSDELGIIHMFSNEEIQPGYVVLQNIEENESDLKEAFIRETELREERMRQEKLREERKKEEESTKEKGEKKILQQKNLELAKNYEKPQDLIKENSSDADLQANRLDLSANPINKILKKKYIKIIIECPGGIKNVKAEIEESSDSFRIIITGEKYIKESPPSTENLEDRRKTGAIKILTKMFEKSNFLITKRPSYKFYRDGQLIYYFEQLNQTPIIPDDY